MLGDQPSTIEEEESDCIGAVKPRKPVNDDLSVRPEDGDLESIRLSMSPTNDASSNNREPTINGIPAPPQNMTKTLKETSTSEDRVLSKVFNILGELRNEPELTESKEISSVPAPDEANMDPVERAGSLTGSITQPGGLPSPAEEDEEKVEPVERDGSIIGRLLRGLPFFAEKDEEEMDPVERVGSLTGSITQPGGLPSPAKEDEEKAEPVERDGSIIGSLLRSLSIFAEEDEEEEEETQPMAVESEVMSTLAAPEVRQVDLVEPVGSLTGSITHPGRLPSLLEEDEEEEKEELGKADSAAQELGGLKKPSDADGLSPISSKSGNQDAESASATAQPPLGGVGYSPFSWVTQITGVVDSGIKKLAAGMDILDGGENANREKGRVEGDKRSNRRRRGERSIRTNHKSSKTPAEKSPKASSSDDFDTASVHSGGHGRGSKAGHDSKTGHNSTVGERHHSAHRQGSRPNATGRGTAQQPNSTTPNTEEAATLKTRRNFTLADFNDPLVSDTKFTSLSMRDLMAQCRNTGIKVWEQYLECSGLPQKEREVVVYRMHEFLPNLTPIANRIFDAYNHEVTTEDLINILSLIEGSVISHASRHISINVPVTYFSDSDREWIKTYGQVTMKTMEVNARVFLAFFELHIMRRILFSLMENGNGILDSDFGTDLTVYAVGHSGTVVQEEIQYNKVKGQKIGLQQMHYDLLQAIAE